MDQSLQASGITQDIRRIILRRNFISHISVLLSAAVYLRPIYTEVLPPAEKSAENLQSFIPGRKKIGNPFMKKYSFLLILAAGSLWGTMGVFVDLLTSLGFSTMNAALLRICSAAVMYVIFLLVKDKKLLVIHNAKGISPSAEGDEGYSPSSSPAFLPLFSRFSFGEKRGKRT